MKRIFFAVAFAMCLSLSSFAQFFPASSTGWPNNLLYPYTVATANKIVAYGSNYYVATPDRGILTIPKSTIGSGTWTTFNNGIPIAGLDPNALPFYSIYDMAISGNYMYILCAKSGFTSEFVYRADMTAGTPTFTSVNPSTSLLSGESYNLKAVGSYVYLCNVYGASTIDIRYTLNTTTTWSTLALAPGGVSPARIYSINALTLSGRWDIHFCCSNGLFIQGTGSTGAPTGGTAQQTSYGDCPLIEYVYNSSGTFTWAYLSQNVLVSPGHYAPGKIVRVASGSSTPSAVTMTPSNTTTSGLNISALATWNGNAHFGVIGTSGSAVSAILYKGDNTANNYVVSNFCGGSGGGVSGTVGTTCMYADGTTSLLAGVYGHVPFYTTNLSCKTDETTGIEEVEGLKLKVYPVPAMNELTVSYSGNAGDSKPAISLYDMQGRQQSVQVDYSIDEAKINTAALARGVYMLEFNNGTRMTKQVVIE